MIAAIVPAGGAGRRMGGVDKAALEVGGVTLLDRVLNAARPVCDRLVVVGPARPTAVAGVEFVTEGEPGGGPAPAVRAGLAVSAACDVVLVVAGDLPLLTEHHLRALVGALDDPDVDAAAASGPGGVPNPLLAAYRAASLRSGLAGAGFGAAASRLLPPATALVDLGPATLNVNRPEDLAAAELLLAGLAGLAPRMEPDRAEEAATGTYPERYAEALGLGLGGDEVETVLDLARVVAHGSERKSAPLSTYLAGQYVAERIRAGVPRAEALAEAVAIGRRLLGGEE